MKAIWNFITAVKNATGNILFLGLLGLIIFAIASRQSSQVPESAIMILDPEGIIVEQKRAVDPFEQFLAGDSMEDEETLSRDIIDSLQLATEDERIKGVALDLSKLGGGSLSIYGEISEAIELFKESGKPVYAFATGYAQSQYYLASFADKIYVDSDSHPFLGGVFLQGFGSYPLYMKAAIDKLSISLHVMKAGVYKDAAETLTRDSMSDYSRESSQLLVDTLWGHYLSGIADQRGLTPDEVSNYIANYADILAANDADFNQVAIDRGLIDASLSRVEWRTEMQELAGVTGDTYNHIGYRSFLAATRPPVPVEDPTTDKVAVIVAKGPIYDGDQPPGTVGGDSLAKLIREARNARTVKAIVLRVDSPGGSASASELIRSELSLTQATGKPVVASFSGVAASGGYWIASTANRIFASDSTITGSIGVFAVFPTVDQSLARLGLHADGVRTTPLSGSFASTLPINPVFKQTLEMSVERTYQKFLSIVAEGRQMSVEDADKIAQGRVWTGDQALEHGLVDAIGGLDDAVESAAMLADLGDYDVVYLEKQLSPRDQLLQQILQTTTDVLPSLSPRLSIPRLPDEVYSLSRIAREPGVYLQCLTCSVSF